MTVIIHRPFPADPEDLDHENSEACWCMPLLVSGPDEARSLAAALIQAADDLETEA